MANRIITGVLVVLVLAAATAGVYAYRLTGEIDSLAGEIDTLTDEISTLGGELTVVRGEQDLQSKGIESVSDALTALDEQSAASLGSLDVRLRASLDRIAASEEAAKQTEAGIDDIEQDIAGLGTEIKQVTANAPLRADQIYQAVSRGVVEVTDGVFTIGTGFVYDGDGHIVTANHVVEDLDEIFIVFPDGRLSAATVVGTSQLSDVAVLQLEAEMNITPLAMADSSLLEAGASVVAIGSPFNLAGSITSGVISQMGRFQEIGSGDEARWIANLIQFDAAANFGNSGGPLFNADGEVLGIIIARIGPERGEGISYAVSANKVRRVADAIIASGAFAYPSLGIFGGDLTPQLAVEIGRDSVHGVVIGSVTPAGPAGQAGFKADDIIVAIDGTKISDMAGLTSYLGEYTSPGDSVNIELERDGVTLELTTELGTR
ncbi:MAG: trypsin-like peptidase domain-containing protein [Dehalococcoidales bacterium]